MADLIQDAPPRYDNRYDNARREDEAVAGERPRHLDQRGRKVTGYGDDDLTVLGAILKRTSWGAIIAGAFVAISVQMILTLLGIAVGITTSEVVSSADRVQDRLQTAAGIWWLGSGTLSLFIGGCVVGRFAGLTRSPDALLHGFTMWSVTALFGFLAVSGGAGVLYGTAMNSTFVGAQSASRTQLDGGKDSSLSRTNPDAAAPAGDTGERVVSKEEARRFVQAASWWTLLGLAGGILAALVGSWATSPDRIAVRPITQSRVVAPTHSV